MASSTAAVLVDVETGLRELRVGVDLSTGWLVATLSGVDLEASGGGPATLSRLSQRTTTATVTVLMNGGNIAADRCRHLEATINLAWTMVGPDSTCLDVTGCALVTGLDMNSLVRFQVVSDERFKRSELDPSCGRRAALDPAAEFDDQVLLVPYRSFPRQLRQRQRRVPTRQRRWGRRGTRPLL